MVGKFLLFTVVAIGALTVYNLSFGNCAICEDVYEYFFEKSMKTEKLASSMYFDVESLFNPQSFNFTHKGKITQQNILCHCYRNPRNSRK